MVISGIMVKSDTPKQAHKSPTDAILEYFSSVMLRIKFDFSDELNIVLAIVKAFPYVFSTVIS
jgi:hypothetical protein